MSGTDLSQSVASRRRISPDYPDVPQTKTHVLTTLVDRCGSAGSKSQWSLPDFFLADRKSFGFLALIQEIPESQHTNTFLSSSPKEIGSLSCLLLGKSRNLCLERLPEFTRVKKCKHFL